MSCLGRYIYALEEAPGKWVTFSDDPTAGRSCGLTARALTDLATAEAQIEALCKVLRLTSMDLNRGMSEEAQRSRAVAIDGVLRCLPQKT